MPYAHQIIELNLVPWHDFYEVLGESSASLLGLLFVVISLNVRAVERGEKGELRWIAAQTFNNFFFCLLVSLDMLAATEPYRITGGLLIATGSIGLVATIGALHRVLSESNRHVASSNLVRLLVPLVANIGVIVAASGEEKGSAWSLYVIVFAALFLISNGLRNAWSLLFRLGTDNSLQPDEPVEPASTAYQDPST